MPLLSLFITTILLPLMSIVWLWRHARNSRASWAATIAFATALVGFTFVAAPWAWLGVWVRWLLLALYVAALVASIRRTPDLEAPKSAFFATAMQFFLAALFGSALIGALAGWVRPRGAVDLAFPLRGGAFAVGQGGSTQVVNAHAVNASQRYALDVARLNAIGTRASGIYPEQLSRYAIWGQEILSPCAGTVVAARDGLADNIPPAREESESNVAGNYVAIDCGSAVVYLAHMQRGSVQVRPGATIPTAQLLGRVGNSGNTTEPHLHVHAEEGPYRGGFSGRPAVAVTYDGRWLARNSVIFR